MAMALVPQIAVQWYLEQQAGPWLAARQAKYEIWSIGEKMWDYPFNAYIPSLNLLFIHWEVSYHKPGLKKKNFHLRLMF